MKKESGRTQKRAVEGGAGRPRFASLPHAVRWEDLPSSKIRIVDRRVVWENTTVGDRDEEQGPCTLRPKTGGRAAAQQETSTAGLQTRAGRPPLDAEALASAILEAIALSPEVRAALATTFRELEHRP